MARGKSHGSDAVTMMLILSGWLIIRLTRGILRQAAGFTAALLPPAPSVAAAAGYAALAAGAWTLVVSLLFAVAGGGNALGFGLLAGAIIGCCIGYAVFERGRSHAAAYGGAVTFGERAGPLGIRAPHLIDRASRVRHVAAFGPTGSGKSTVLTNLVLQDAAAPGAPGILCIDIKDDFAVRLMDYLPAQRLADVVMFDPSDTAYPPAFNPLADIPPEERTLASAELLNAFKRLYHDAWGPRLEHVLRHILLTLVETPEATLLDIPRILTDAAYREWAVSHVTNFSVKQFWSREFPSIAGKNGSVANVESLLNKLSVFSYPEVRNVVGQTRRGLDLSDAMAQGKIVLAHLPQGILGEDISHFLAALLVGKAQLAAQRRVQLSPSQRRPFYIFADEFQNYDTSAFTKLITEGRSMAVGLVMACQFREQLPLELRLAVEKNCAYGLLCRQVDGRHLVEVIKFQEPTAPDAATLVRALPPPHDRTAGQRTTIRQQSRDLLARPKAVVEAAIARRMMAGMQTPPPQAADPVSTTAPEETMSPPPAPVPTDPSTHRGASKRTTRVETLTNDEESVDE